MRALKPQFAQNEPVWIVGTGTRYDGKNARIVEEEAYGCWVRVEDKNLQVPLRYIHKNHLVKLNGAATGHA